MQVTKVLGLAAVGALLVLAAPTERAQALSLSNPGAAAAVQQDIKADTTEVRWGRHQWLAPRLASSPLAPPSSLAPLVNSASQLEVRTGPRNRGPVFVSSLFAGA